MEIVLVKQTDNQLSPEDAAVVRKFLFHAIDGVTVRDKRAWRRFCGALNDAGSGEYFSIKTQRPREGWYHRKHMALESKVFKAQERVEHFDQFRLWLKIGAGFVTWMAGPKGGVFPVPKSISYDQCEEDEMRQFHEDVVKFLRTEHAQHYLWPALTPQVAEQSIESILEPFERPRQ